MHGEGLRIYFLVVMNSLCMTNAMSSHSCMVNGVYSLYNCSFLEAIFAVD